MNTSVRGKFLAALRNSKAPKIYPKRIASRDLLEAIRSVLYFGTPLIVKDSAGNIYRIKGTDFAGSLIDIDGRKVNTWEIVDYFLFPRPLFF